MSAPSADACRVNTAAPEVTPPVDAGAEPAEIVVGVDGSPAAQAALAWAVAEAKAHRRRLRVVHAWRDPALAVRASLAPLLPLDGPSRYEAKARDLVRNAVAQATDAGVGAAGAVVYGAAGQILVARSQTADLLVVGASGSRRRAGLLLGSVAQHCVRHADCPITVVSSRSQPADSRGRSQSCAPTRS
jgi:nucleotide-binding universal stress UspA family protein